MNGSRFTQGSTATLRDFATELWNLLIDGGVWGVPRCGLVYSKREAERQFPLAERMPWQEGMPVTPEELREQQDYDHERIARMFSLIGVEVTDETSG